MLSLKIAWENYPNLINPHLRGTSPSWAGRLSPGRVTEEQVLALTSLTESGFERKIKTGRVLVDLSAAYGTVWRDGLLYKIARIIKDQSILKIISVMTGTRKFLVCSGGSESKMYKIRNGVPQGSVLAPLLFNIYIGDLPETISQKLGYADSWALASQSSSFDTIKRTLSDDIKQLKRYFDKWYLRMNSSKSTTTAFHISNHTDNLTMEVSADNVLLPPQAEPKYLGVTLDISLTYRTHIEDTSQKLKSWVPLSRRWLVQAGVIHRMFSESLPSHYAIASLSSPHQFGLEALTRQRWTQN